MKLPGSWRGSSFCPQCSSWSSEEAGRYWPATKHKSQNIFLYSLNTALEIHLHFTFQKGKLSFWTSFTCIMSPLFVCLFFIALHSDVTYVKVRHAWFFELVPESPGDDVNWDVVSDDSADAGQGGLDRTEGGRTFLRQLFTQTDWDVTLVWLQCRSSQTLNTLPSRPVSKSVWGHQCFWEGFKHSR